MVFANGGETDERKINFGCHFGLGSLDKQNDVRHGGSRKNGQHLFQWCSHYLEEFWAFSVVHQKSSQTCDSMWTPPIAPAYKVNVYGAVYSSQRAVGVRVIIQDHKGKFIAGLCKKIQAPLGAIEVEAKAFELGLLLGKEVGILNFVLEGDSLIVVQSMCENAPTPSLVAPVVYGILATSHEFCNVHFSHVRRQGNRPAYLLAKFALGIYDYLAQIEENHYFLEQALLYDVSCTLI